jgi:hypothetical protein
MSEERPKPPTGLPPPIGRGIFRKIDHFFGFGFYSLDAKIFAYAAGTAVCGLGLGLYCPRAPAIISIALIAAGAIVANIAHAKLKKEAGGAIGTDAPAPPAS